VLVGNLKPRHIALMVEMPVVGLSGEIRIRFLSYSRRSCDQNIIPQVLNNIGNSVFKTIHIEMPQVFFYFIFLSCKKMEKNLLLLFVIVCLRERVVAMMMMMMLMMTTTTIIYIENSVFKTIHIALVVEIPVVGLSEGIRLVKLRLLIEIWVLKL
jgi:hypothetical protein